MNTKINKLYFIIPILYAGIIAGLLSLQFSGTDRFKEQVLNIVIEGKGSADPLGRTSGVTGLTVFCEGIRLPFEHNGSVKISLQDGKTENRQILGYSVTDNGIELLFDGNFSLGITGGEAGSGFQLSAGLTGGRSEIQTIAIPFVPESDTIIQSGNKIPVYSFLRDNDVRFLSLTSFSVYDLENDQLLLTPGENGYCEALYRPSEKNIINPVEYWFSSIYDNIGEANYTERVNNFLNSAYSGWKNTRFSSESGTWRGKDEPAQYNEKIIAALLSESLSKREYTYLQGQMILAAAKHPDNLSETANLYLGSLIKTNEAYVKSQEDKTSAIRRMVNNADFGVFRSPDNIKFAYYSSPDDLYQALFSLAETVTVEIDPTELLWLFYSFLEIGELENLFSKEELHELIQTVITANIVDINNLIFFESGNGEADLYLSVIAGTVLEKIAVITESFIDIPGRALKISALSLADEDGFIPAFISADSGEINMTAGTVYPEDIYLFLVDSPYYPKELDLSASLLPGSSVRTVTEDFTFEQVGEKYILEFKFPIGGIHNIILHGMKPFGQVELFGIPWNSTALFQRYSSGWYYDEDTESMLIKLKQGRETERIVINTKIILQRPSPAPVSAPAPVSTEATTEEE